MEIGVTDGLKNYTRLQVYLGLSLAYGRDQRDQYSQ